MYLPPHFRDDDSPGIHATIRTARLCNLVTATADGLIATPLPMILDETEAANGVLYGHVARANPQWKTPVTGEAMAIFMGPDRSEEHTSELQSLMRISYAVFCLKKKTMKHVKNTK